MNDKLKYTTYCKYLHTCKNTNCTFAHYPGQKRPNYCKNENCDVESCMYFHKKNFKEWNKKNVEEYDRLFSNFNAFDENKYKKKNDVNVLFRKDFKGKTTLVIEFDYPDRTVKPKTYSDIVSTDEKKEDPK